MKRLSIVLLLSFILLGCTSTASMVQSPSSDTSLGLEEKLQKAGIDKVLMTEPKIYYSGTEWLAHLTSLVSNAKKYVVLTSFLASDSQEVELLYQAIVKKAKEGVPVYFLVDGVGMFDMTESRYHLIPLLYLNDTPVHFLEFNPMSTARLISGSALLYRYHQKVIIIDGQTMALGGMNLNYISIGATGASLQRDSMYEFSSPGAIQEFLDWFVPWWNDHSWDHIDRDSFSIENQPDKEKPSRDAWFINQVPGNKQLLQAYGSLISSAKESIEILPFLPALDGNMLKALKEAIDRGVKVSMVISYDPRTSDRYLYLPLLEIGVQMRLESEKADLGLLHEKLMVVDGRYVLFGSSNFNYRSMALSYESSAIIDDPSFAVTVQKHFQQYFDDAVEVSLDEAKKWRTVDKYLMHLLMTVGG